MALEGGEPRIVRIDPAVVLESLTYGVHLRKHAHKPGIITRTMDAITAPARNRLRLLPAFFGLV